MSAAAAHAVAAQIELHSVLDVCAFVDGLARDEAGELTVNAGDGAKQGAIFVERGRICWAAARGLSRRLSDLLASSASVDRARMEVEYVRCARDRVPLGEHLVGSGLVTADQLRVALRQHTSESLRALFREGRRTEWVARRSGGYSARFTFATPEILADANAQTDAQVAEEARRELADTLQVAGWGAAFLRSNARAVPDLVAIVGDTPDRIDPVLRVGRWACSALDVVGVAHTDDALIAAMDRDTAFVAWRHGRTIVAGQTGTSGPARILNRRARMRRKESSHGGV